MGRASCDLSMAKRSREKRVLAAVVPPMVLPLEVIFAAVAPPAAIGLTTSAILAIVAIVATVDAGVVIGEDSAAGFGDVTTTAVGSSSRRGENSGRGFFGCAFGFTTGTGFGDLAALLRSRSISARKRS